MKKDDNEILEYMEDIIYFKKHDDKEGLQALIDEGVDKNVTLRDVGFTFLQVMDDLTDYVHASQGLTEMRLREIVNAIAFFFPEIKERLLKEFEEADDDLLLEYEDEGENNNG